MPMNFAKTAMLLAMLTAIFVAMGAVVGGREGMVIAFVIAVGTNAFAFWNSDTVVLKMFNTQPVMQADAPRLHDLVATLATRAGLPMPKVYLLNTPQPNAFATGRNPSNSAVAVSSGLLDTLSWEELAGVIAHELAHIKNRDMLISTIAAGIGGAISYLPFLLMAGGRDDEDGGHPLTGFAVAILGQAAAMILQFAISRQREFEADRVGAEILGQPMPLANALKRLDRMSQQIPMRVAPAAAPLAQVNPLAAGGGRMLKLFSTHPPTEERVAKLLAIRAR